MSFCQPILLGACKGLALPNCHNFAANQKIIRMQNSGNPFEAIDSRFASVEAMLTRISQQLETVHATEPDTAPELLNKKQAAALLAVSQSTVDNYARAGIIERIKLGKAVRFRRAELLALTNPKNLEQ